MTEAKFILGDTYSGSSQGGGDRSAEQRVGMFLTVETHKDMTVRQPQI